MIENNPGKKTEANETAPQKESVVNPEVLKTQATQKIIEIQSAESIFEQSLQKSGYTPEEIEQTESELGVTEELKAIKENTESIENELKEEQTTPTTQPEINQRVTESASVEQNAETTPEDFKFNVKRLVASLEKQQESATEGYVYTVGQFKEKTSVGKELLIDSILYHKNGNMFDDVKATNLVLVAKDLDTSSIEGLRLTTINDKPVSSAADTLDYKTQGFIVTKNKGAGVASALDRAYENALKLVVNQRDAQSEEIYQNQLVRDPELAEAYKRRPEQITWSVQNKNLEEMLKLENELRWASQENDTEKIELLKKQVEQKKKEQERWQALYGEGGKLGMKLVDPGSPTFSPGQYYKRPKYEKVIQPDPGTTDTAMKSIDPGEFTRILTELKKSIE